LYSLYHIINRGNYRRPVFGSVGAAQAFESALWEAVQLHGWRVHAYVLMTNHYHLALETPQPPLGPGMPSIHGLTDTDDTLDAVGTIDPRMVSLVLMHHQEPVLVLTYYATHPQSYYRTGGATPDFPGLARDSRQEETGVPHLHFTGAAGNIGAGKWNDGDPANRAVLTERMRLAMQTAFEQALEDTAGQGPTPLTAEDVDWKSLEVRLPLAEHLQEQQLARVLGDPDQAVMSRLNAAMQLAYLREHQAGQGIAISRWRIGGVDTLHMPAELFVEYQLAAQRLQPDRTVAMAAYGQYGPQYIGTAVAYEQGGYETSPRASCVDQQAEPILMGAIAELLGVPPARLSEVLPLGVPVDAPVTLESRAP
jgi:hypothetical protein